MGEDRRKWEWRIGAWPLMAALAYFSVGMITLRWASGSEGLAVLWPSAGIFVATLLLIPGSRRPAVIALFTLAGALGDWIEGVDAWLAVTFVAANSLHATVCALILGHGRCQQRAGKFRELLRFCGAAAVGALASGLFIGLVMPGWPMQGLTSWAVTIFLGTLIITPLIVMVARDLASNRSKLDMRFAAEFIVLVGMLAVVSWLCVTTSAHPLLFVPIAVSVLITYRLRSIGAAGCVAALAIVGSIAITTGVDALNSTGRPVAQVMYFYQLYLIVAMAVCLSLAALLTQRDVMVRGLQTTKDLLSAAERLTNIGHWYQDIRTQELVWSDGIYRIYDLPRDRKPSVQLVRGFCHPDDLDLILERLDHCIKEGGTEAGTTRIVRLDGSIRHIEAIMMREVDKHGRPVALFGTFQDVTEKVEALAKLEAAKTSAECEASAARLLAETDQLTGVNSRRKIMEVLGSEIERCRTQRLALSVAILDIDYFKSINDQFGHAIGDEVLRIVSSICRDAIDGLGELGRLGGEEFLFVFPDTDAAQVRAIIENVRRAIMAMDWQDYGDLEVTGSFGLVTMVDGADETWLLQAADNALYEAKHQGRNCLRIAA